MRTAIALTILMLSLLAVASCVEARPVPPVSDCVGKPGAAAVCVTEGIGGTCVSAGVGLQGASVCKRSDGLRVCTSMYTALYGYCPTDLIRTD